MSRPSSAIGLRAVFRANAGRILTTYGLFNLESGLRLAQPFVLGLTVDRLLAGDAAALLGFLALQLGYVLAGSARQAYDTRVFTRIYAKLAAGLVTKQRRHGVELSRVAARSALAREIVDFFELDVPLLFTALYSVIGALVMLGFYDARLVAYCLVLCVPIAIGNAYYGRATRRLNTRLNDQLEREVGVIEQAEPRGLREHYSGLSATMVKLSDLSVMNFGLAELLVTGLMAAALLRVTGDAARPGEILAALQYVLMFAAGLDRVPPLAKQVGRLRDISGRLHVADDDVGRAPAAAHFTH